MAKMVVKTMCHDFFFAIWVKLVMGACCNQISLANLSPRCKDAFGIKLAIHDPLKAPIIIFSQVCIPVEVRLHLSLFCYKPSDGHNKLQQ